ncbi:MAG: tRNA pseudouridine(38-40) synthase TruA [Rickettsiales bacterium]|nr:tRNA pseudouridine(38-40) synthase TruA [Rickettsiales bacterium]|tara:strand:+ start:1156 stop:1890 length:735 start_codon:yes stop_codon:yes gene_type:complete
MYNYKIIVEYDGTNFVGWQQQENGKSIQSALQEALVKLSGEKVTIFGAGRTDAGVHAYGQVASFTINKKIEIEVIRDGLNQHLRPQPIAVQKAELVDSEFHARFSAKKRSYEYRIINRRSPLTIDANRAWCIYKKINVEKMKSESSSFLGKHDLNAFRSSHCQSKSSTKTIESIDIKNEDEQIIFHVSAKSFLHSQVRIMVGTLVDIAKGNINKTISDIINSKNRKIAGQTAPAHGLYLKKIDY